MADLLSEFWHDAQAIRLTASEREAALHVITTAMESSSIRLSPAERAMGREQLIAFMEANPVTKTTFFSRVFLALRGVAIACGMVILAGGAAAGAAEYSLPGNFLYPVKIHVTEPIVGLLQQSPKARTEWNLIRLKRRIDEVQQISVQEKSNRLERHLPLVGNEIGKESEEILQTLEELPVDESVRFRKQAIETLEKGRPKLRELGEALPERAKLAIDAITASEGDDDNDPENSMAIPARLKRFLDDDGDEREEKKEKQKRRGLQILDISSPSSSSSSPPPTSSTSSSSAEMASVSSMAASSILELPLKRKRREKEEDKDDKGSINLPIPGVVPIH